MKVSVVRIVGVTIGLGLVGALCGAVLGGLALVIDVAPAGLRALAVALLIGSLWGAVFGAVFAPLVAWLFLRRVSFGRAIAQTALGILFGLLVGAIVAPSASFLFGLLGFLLSAVWLWITSRRVERKPHMSSI